MDIDILCKVVDNYGDIGVVYRLARSLSERPDAPRLRLIVDDLVAFALLEPSVDPGLAWQEVRGWELFRWHESEGGPGQAAFRARRPTVVLECFACRRPDWLEAILFDPAGRPCLLVDLEHLTAEPYADDFHRMPSLTRSPRVRKAMFLPGFTAATGGLIMDESFARSRRRAESSAGRLGLRRELVARLGPVATTTDASGAGAPGSIVDGASVEAALPLEELFWVCVFSYERDYSRVVADLAAFQAGSAGDLAPGPLVLAAAGASQDRLVAAWSAAGRPFRLIRLPFLPQEAWDEVLLSCDFSIVRGEDSWARAALTGRPFLWQAYPQDGRHQMVKVAAFLDRLGPYLEGAAGFQRLRDLYAAFNDRDSDGPDVAGSERLLPVLERLDQLRPGFGSFAESLARAPDLASNLLTFLREIV